MSTEDFIKNFIKIINNNNSRILDDMKLGDYINIDLQKYHDIDADTIVVQEYDCSDYKVTIEVSGISNIWIVTRDGRIQRKIQK